MKQPDNGVSTPLPSREGLGGGSGVNTIKQALRSMMNGVASAAMRDAGMTADYRVNFGVELPRLQELAYEVKGQRSKVKGQTPINSPRERSDVEGQRTDPPQFPEGEVKGDDIKSLAQELWHERVRECRILATMIYPAEEFDGELADIWADDIRTVELAQITALHLFSRMPRASEKAFQWIASENDQLQLIGYYTLAHLLRTAQLSERSTQELRDQAAVSLQSDNAQLRLAAQRALDRLPL